MEEARLPSEAFRDLVYLQEVELQCRYAENAVGDYNFILEKLLEEDSTDRREYLQNEVFRTLHSFLTHTSNVSKLLWPTGTGRAKRRGRRLRSLLSVTDDNPLRSRTLRNHLEHFDERLDTWAEETGGNLFLNVIGPRSAVLADEGITVIPLRWLDSETAHFHFRGEEFDLQELADAAKELQEAVPAARSEVSARLGARTRE